MATSAGDHDLHLPSQLTQIYPKLGVIRSRSRLIMLEVYVRCSSMKKALVLVLFLISVLSLGQFNVGGMMRGIMTAPVTMLAVPDVKKELKLSGDQNKQIDKLCKDHQKKMQELSKGTRTDPSMGMGIAKTLNEETDKASAACMEVLNPEQALRLKEIRLQVLGAAALYEPELQKDLELTEEQVGKVNEYSQGEAGRMMELMQGARDPKALQKKVKEGREADEAALTKILTSEQIEKFKAKQGPPSSAAKKLKERLM